MCHLVSSRLFSISSRTGRPPTWMQKWLKANLKSGMYGLIFILNTFLATKVMKNQSYFDIGSTAEPRVVMLVFMASSMTATKSMDSDKPIFFFFSSRWNKQP
ncbi:hypothetical protein EUGRSUZ_H00231 [Eucalyptus grandis]|uniref:Uncharacterized protein n=2 Tax=Eucalyptus grandis TaxID=71139 RepID=A0ACC3JML3_EUCGR|nr:hypothetical protein EUGRSUZ_H00231 [Eucalyptus grandis]